MFISVEASPAKARRHFKAGEYKSALSEYQKLIEKDPADPRLRYNAGAAAYRAQSYDEAIKQFQAAVGAQDPELQRESFYNLGNSEYLLGEAALNPQEKTALWEQALQHYEAALKINAADADARHNREIVARKLEELKKQQQQQQNQDNQDQQKQDQKDQGQNQDQQKQNNQNQQEQNQKGQEQKQDNSESNQQQEKSDQQKQDAEEQRQQQQANQEQQQDQQGQQAQQNQTGGDKEGEQDPQEAQQGQFAQAGSMTPAQARQMLDAHRSEEKALLFLPEQRKSQNQNRSFKDW